MAKRTIRYSLIITAAAVLLSAGCAFLSEIYNPLDVSSAIENGKPKTPAEGPDTTLPTVLISSPTNGQKVFSNFTVIIGAYDDKGISQVNLHVSNIDGTFMTNVNVSNSGGQYPSLVKVPVFGTYHIWADATDTSGNISVTPENTLTACNMPYVEIISPVGNEMTWRTNASSVQITGKAYTPGSTLTQVALIIGGTTNNLGNSSDWSFTASITPNAMNVIKVYAENNFGEKGDSLIYILNDTFSPNFIIDTPTNNNFVTSIPLLISGTASDVGLSGVEGVYLSVNGGAFSRMNGITSWNSNLTLTDGTHEFRVFSKDNAGNISVTNKISNTVQLAVYASLSGNDGNPGTKNSPMKTIQLAISKAVSMGLTNVYIESPSGLVYNTTNGLLNSGYGIIITNNNIHLKGGFQPGFNSMWFPSVLNGEDTLKHVIIVSNCNNVFIEGLQITKGKADGYDYNYESHGGGIIILDSSACKISNCYIQYNNSTGYGAGIALVRSSYNYILSNFIDANTNTGYGGGGLNLTYATNNIITGVYRNNKGGYGGPIYYNTACKNNNHSEAYFSGNDPAGVAGGN